jgi:tetrathionate reductase subunit B
VKAFVVDVKICEGCRDCQVACKDEHCGNDWMPYAKPQPLQGQFWLKVDERVRGTIPQVKVAYVPTLCMQCDNAPCIPVCPTKALSQRPDGIVMLDPAKCQGNKKCIAACPYNVIFYNDTLKISQKCTGCAHLLDRGWPIKEPRCVDACPPGAIKFGEEADLKDLIAKAEALPPLTGTAPKVRVYYLNLPKRFITGTVYDPAVKDVVVGATVALSGDATATATTDGFGDFWFEGLKVGKYSVKITKDAKTKTIDAIDTTKDVSLGDVPLA